MRARPPRATLPPVLRLLPALAALTIVPAAASRRPAAAAAKPFAGTTAAGTPVTLDVTGKRAAVKSFVAMACVKTGGSSGTKAGIDPSGPPAPCRDPGTDRRSSSQQNPSAVLGGHTVTINYHVEAAPRAARSPATSR